MFELCVPDFCVVVKYNVILLNFCFVMVKTRSFMLFEMIKYLNKVVVGFSHFVKFIKNV